MQKNRFLRGAVTPPILLAALLIAVGLASDAAAVEVATLYTADVPVNSEAQDPRKDAYERALAKVLLRVSGPGLRNNAATIAELFGDPASYVMQYRRGANDTLWVSFDGQAIERTLREAGQSVWGAERPLTLVWLAVDWGQGNREIIAADDRDRSEQESRSIDRNKQLRQRVLEIAEQRGLPLVFPLLDTQDLQGVTFSDIWGGFDDRVIAASQRYDADSILIGRIRASSGRRENWTYFFNGVDRSWNGPPETVVGQVADLLASEFAVGGDAPASTVALAISGVATLADYGSLQKLLAGVSLIESVVTTSVSGDRISFRVEVRGGADRLRRALQFNGLIEQESPPGPGGLRPASELEFFYGR
ncbi:MAG: DUF2066 domain-containing protein [Woeseiaceae bacterium]|nr:DUF2066 domain-containing protein [Woeseiaceae bacterium]